MLFGKLPEVGYFLLVYFSITRDRFYDPKIIYIAIPEQDIWHGVRQRNQQFLRL